ncbi:MAG: WD40 repeat domain-containing protein [Bacteroidales bacterium]|nr:WD40 repeat domain-containing protein [Bacteroidales bacterium]
MLRRLLTVAGLLVVCGILSAQVPDPIQVFKGHTEPVYAVAFSPDGSMAATGSFDKTIKLWDTKTGQVLRTLGGRSGHQNQVLSVAFSPDGTLLASGGADNQAKIWRVPAPTPTATLTVPVAASTVAVTTDGKTYAVGGSDGTIQLFTATDNKPSAKLTGHAGAVTGLTFTPGGQQLLSVGADRILRYWNVAQAKLLAEVGVSEAAISGLAVSPNGAIFTSSADGELQFWPAQLPNPPGKPAPPLPAPLVALALSRDGNHLLTATTDKGVQLSRLTDGQRPLHWDKLPAEVQSVAQSGNAQAFAAGLKDGKLLIWNNDGKLRATVSAHTGPIVAVEFLSNDQLQTAGADGFVRVWRVPTAGFPKEAPAPKPEREYQTPTRSAMTTGATIAIAASAAGKFVTAETDQSVKLWETDPQKPAKKLGTLPTAVTRVAVTGDASLTAAASGKIVKVWNNSDGKEIPVPPLPADVSALDFSFDRTKLVIGLVNHTAWVIDLKKGERLQFAVHPGPATGSPVPPVTAVAFHPNGQWFFTASADNTVALHPLLMQRRIVDPTRIGTALAIMQNGSRLLTGHTGNNLTFWNTGNGNVDKTVEVAGPITAIAAAKNNQLIAVAHGAEPKISILNPNDGQVIGSFSIGANGVKVTELLFHPSNLAVIGLLSDQRAIAWNLDFDPNQPLPPEFGQPIQTYAHATPTHGLAVTNDGNSVLTASDDKQCRIWSFAPIQPLKSLTHPNLVDAVAFDHTSKQLATGCHDGQLRIWDVEKGQATKTIAAHTQPQPGAIYCLAWSPNDSQIVTGSFDHALKLWDVASAKLVRETKPAIDRYPPEPTVGQTAPAILGSLGGGYLNAPPSIGHRDQVFGVAVDSAGKHLASCSSDRTAIVWNFTTGEPEHLLANPKMPTPPPGLPRATHPGFVNAAQFTPDGQRLVTVGPAPRGAGYLAVWSVADGKLIAGLELPHGPVHALAVRPDGAAILLGFGIRSRLQTECDAVILPLPK